MPPSEYIYDTKHRTSNTFNTSFFNKKLIDDFKLFISNKKFAKNGSGSIKKYFRTFLKNKKKNSGKS